MRVGSYVWEGAGVHVRRRADTGTGGDRPARNHIELSQYNPPGRTDVATVGLVLWPHWGACLIDRRSGRVGDCNTCTSSLGTLGSHSAMGGYRVRRGVVWIFPFANALSRPQRAQQVSGVCGRIH
mgnify:CR=1 FL=1